MENTPQHTSIPDELKEIAPGLNDLPLEDGFRVPHNYFKELPDRVWNRLQVEQTAPVSLWERLQDLIWPQKGRFYPALAFASVLLLIVAGVLYTKPQVTQDPLASVTQDEALEYVLDNLQDFSSEDLIATGMIAEWDASEVTPVSEDDLDQMMNEMILDESLMDDLMMN